MSESKSARMEALAIDDGDKGRQGEVPLKYQGTAADRQDMSVLGKKQVLRRQFKFWTMLGFASTVVRREFHDVRSTWVLTVTSPDGRLGVSSAESNNLT